MRVPFVIICAACGFGLIATPCFAAGKKIALIIANTTYSASIGKPLKHPGEGAEMVAEALGKIGGFEYSRANGATDHVVHDANAKTLKDEIDAFVARVQAAGKGATSFFYYAGHGVADRQGVNYLIPTDIDFRGLQKLGDNSYRLDTLIEALRPYAGHGSHFIVIDACRSELKQVSAESLTVVEREDLPDGIFLVFASGAGKPTPDDLLFASVLSEHLINRNLSAYELFIKVREAVYKRSNVSREPSIVGRLTSKVFFGPPPQPLPGDVMAIGERYMLFVRATNVYRHASSASGVIEIRGQGSTHFAGSVDEINETKEGGQSWITFQTNWEVGYVPKQYVQFVSRDDENSR